MNDVFFALFVAQNIYVTEKLFQQEVSPTLDQAFRATFVMFLLPMALVILNANQLILYTCVLGNMVVFYRAQNLPMETVVVMTMANSWLVPLIYFAAYQERKDFIQNLKSKKDIFDKKAMFSKMHEKIQEIHRECSVQKIELEERCKGLSTLAQATMHDMQASTSTIEYSLMSLSQLTAGIPEAQSPLADIFVSSKSFHQLLGGLSNSMDLLEGKTVPILLEEMNVHDLVNHCIDHMPSKHPATNAELTYHANIEEGVPLSIYSDTALLRQNIMHLLDNAAKHTSEGSISIEASYCLYTHPFYYKSYFLTIQLIPLP